MRTVKMKGKTTEEAIKGALEVLKTDRDSVNVRILDEGEPAKLGVFGGRDAEVEVGLKLEPAEAAKIFLQDILDKIGFMAQVYIKEISDNIVTLDIKGDDISRIIGRDGHTIDAIEYIVNIVSNKGVEIRKRIVVDAGGYRGKQERRVEKIAKEFADEVLISKKEITLPPMNAKERRIVHMTIKTMKGISSNSIGTGTDRCVVISPQI